MRRVAPSVIAREQLAQLLAGGVERETNIVSALVETVTRLVVQELLEGEQTDFLGGRGRYDRRDERSRSARATAMSGAGCAPRKGSSTWRFRRSAAPSGRSARR